MRAVLVALELRPALPTPYLYKWGICKLQNEVKVRFMLDILMGKTCYRRIESLQFFVGVSSITRRNISREVIGDIVMTHKRYSDDP